MQLLCVHVCESVYVCVCLFSPHFLPNELRVSLFPPPTFVSEVQANSFYLASSVGGGGGGEKPHQKNQTGK